LIGVRRRKGPTKNIIFLILLINTYQIIVIVIILFPKIAIESAIASHKNLHQARNLVHAFDIIRNLPCGIRGIKVG
jgi:hypothetical protein